MAEKAKKPIRWWRVAFAVSLALNVLVVGFVLGAGARGHVGGSGPRGFELALGPIGQSLGKEDRRAIGERMRKNPDLRGLRRSDLNGIAAEFANTLRADPFVPEDAAAVLDQARSRIETVHGAARVALLEQVGSMTAQERAALADRIEGAGRRKP